LLLNKEIEFNLPPLMDEKLEFDIIFLRPPEITELLLLPEDTWVI
jgi:hypothetical protein